MSSMQADDNRRPTPDTELTILADYISDATIKSPLAYSTARYCLMDALGCAILALSYPACTRLLGPIVPGTIVPSGSHVPGTAHYLDPVQAAFNIGTQIRWLDYNDTWLAAEWGHPSDNLGAILAVSDYMSETQPKTVGDVLTAMIKAYEIQGTLALKNSFNRLGLDHVVLVKIASTAVAMQLLGGNKHDIINALSNAFIDGQSLRTYRHAPNTGSRKSWAAGDATSRAVRLALLTRLGEMGYPSALSATTWGFNAVINHNHALQLPESFGSYVMENILFKIAYPAEFHAQTAVECAIILHQQIKHKLDQIDKIVLFTQESAMRIISKTGPLYNPADRDHCLQYMVAVALLQGDLTADFYEDAFASDTRIDQLREKMSVQEDLQYTKDYLDPNKRSITNAIQLFFKDGSQTDKIVIEYPLGHKNRRDEAVPLLINKFKHNLSKHYSKEHIEKITPIFLNLEALEQLTVPELMRLFPMP